MNIIPAALRGPATESAPRLDTLTAGRTRRTPDPLDIAAVAAAGSQPTPGELVAAGCTSVDLVPALDVIADVLTAAVTAVPCGPGQWVVTLSTGRRLRVTAPAVHRGC